MTESQLAPASTALAPQGAAPTPQYSAPFLYSDAFTAVKEGGSTKNDGRGNAANFGIDQKAHPEIDVMKLTPQEAQAIRYKYWQAINGDALAKLNPKAALIAYDTAIMAGPSKAVELVTLSQGNAQKMYQLRLGYMDNLIKKDPKTYGPVAKGWAERNDDLGKVAGVIPGKANMPDLEQIAKNGVYVPAGYSPADTKNTQMASAGSEAQPKAAAETTEDAVQAGITGATKAGEGQKPAQMSPLQPTVAMPAEAIVPTSGASYEALLAKAPSMQGTRTPQPAATAPVATTPAVSNPPKAYMQPRREQQNEQQA